MDSGPMTDPMAITDLPDPLDFPVDAPADLTTSQGMEAYLNQVSGIFENSLVGLDHNLTAWHDAILAEMQSSQNNTS